MLHRYCLQNQQLVALFVISDLITFLAYMFIPFQIWRFFQAGKLKFPHHHVFYWAVAFIALCGTTHLAHAWTMVYRPDYLIEAGLLAATAIASSITAMFLLPALVYFAGFKNVITYRAISHDLRNQLQIANAQLEIREMRQTTGADAATARLKAATDKIERILEGIEARNGNEARYAP